MTFFSMMYNSIKYVFKEIIKLGLYVVRIINHIIYKIKLKKEVHPSKQVNLHGKYHCKMKGTKTKLALQDTYLHVNNRQNKQDLNYKWIKNIKLQVKWWRIRVGVHTNKGKFTFDFPSYKEAHKLYEELIYKKIESKG